MKFAAAIVTALLLSTSVFAQNGTALQDRTAESSEKQRASRPSPPREQQTLILEIEADEWSREGNVWIYEGYVDARVGNLRLQTDRLVFNEATNEAEAIGNVVFDQNGQRITGSRAKVNLKSQTGTIWNATGFTDRTPDGTTLYFEAERVTRLDADTYEIYKARVTSCEGTSPMWSFTTQRMKLRLNKRVSLTLPAFRVKNVPLLVLPYASVPISRRVRNSGFLIPGFSKSSVKGITFTIPYYQTLGRSADITPRFEVFTARGIGYGADLRTRTGEESFLNAGFFIVQDRLFGQEGPNQGGTAFYTRAVQYFPKGFVGTADVNLTSSFAFRQVFSDSFQQAISPEERTQLYLNNNFGSYSFDLLFLSRDIFLPAAARLPDTSGEQTAPPGTLVTFRRLPSIEVSGRPQKLSDRVPVYLSFEGAIEGVARKEPTFKTPSIVQRLDANPRFTLPFVSFAGLTITPDVGLRTTYYSDSADPKDRTRILGGSFTRKYLELSVDLRPPAFERVFHHRDGSRWFKHLIEPSVAYRKITGVGENFARVIRVDEKDAVADTSEFEYSLANRFFVTRTNKEGEPFAYELLSLTFSQKYFFDPEFGGALIQGERNQFFPINTLSGYSYGGEPRRLSPLNVSARLQPLSSLFADVRFDYDTRQKSFRAFSVAAGLRKQLFSLWQTWYLAKRVAVGHGRFEAGTFSGNLYQSSFAVGDQERAVFARLDLLYDFTDRIAGGTFSPGRLVSSTVRAGYSFECCSFLVQNTTFKVGLRSENRLSFALVLKGVGSFGSTAAGRRFFDPYVP